MQITEDDPRFDPILKLLVVDAARHSPVRTTGAVVRFARAAESGRPSDPLEEEPWELAVPLEDGRGDGLRTDDDGLLTIALEVLDRRQDITHPQRPPDWTEGWLARVEVRAHGFLPARTDWIPAPMRAEDEPHRVELSSAPVVGGRVVDERGAPIAGVELELVRRIEDGKRLRVRSCFGVEYRDDHDVSARTTTDAAGAFSLPYSEDASLRIRSRVLGRTPVETEPIALRLAKPPAPCEIVMTVPDGGIEGTVRGFDGAPAAGALVVACRADGFAQLVTADAEGRYRLPLPPGRYRVNRGDPRAPRSRALTWSRQDLGRRHLSGKAPAVDPAQFTVEVQAGGYSAWDLDARRPHGASLIVHVDAEDEDPATLPVYVSRVPDEEVVELAWPRRMHFDSRSKWC